jgi:hypothetical protein
LAITGALISPVSFRVNFDEGGDHPAGRIRLEVPHDPELI